jgi:SAM-dependent methyltransferase
VPPSVHPAEFELLHPRRARPDRPAPSMRRRTISAMRVSRLAAGSLAGAAGAAMWWRHHPSACPYSQRLWVEAPHPLITRARLREALDPRPGERLLEVGPGTGYYSLPVGGWIGPGGALELADVQPEMLEHTMRRAREAGLANLAATEADARDLPFEASRFDGAFLVTVLGEVPDQDAALRELARVVRPGGRVVVGELFGDPHWVAPGTLRGRGERAGLRFERRVGPKFGCFTWFARP